MLPFRTKCAIPLPSWWTAGSAPHTRVPTAGPPTLLNPHSRAPHILLDIYREGAVTLKNGAPRWEVAAKTPARTGLLPIELTARQGQNYVQKIMDDSVSKDIRVASKAG